MTTFLNKIKLFFKGWGKEYTIAMIRDEINIAGKLGQYISFNVNQIDSIYLTEIDNITYNEDYIVFVLNNFEYFVPRYYIGFDKIVDEIIDYGLKIDKNWNNFFSDTKAGQIYTIYSKSV